MTKFSYMRKFDGRIFKLATLGHGTTKSKANKTAKMNKAEGNFVRIIKSGNKYAVYVKKTTWKDWK